MGALRISDGKQVKVTQDDGLPVPQHLRGSRDHDGLRVQYGAHIPPPGSRRVNIVHRQPQFLGDEHRQGDLNPLHSGADSGGVQHLTLRGIILHLQRLGDAARGAADVQLYLGIGHLVNELLLAPDLNLAVGHLELSGVVALRHVAHQLAFDLHLLAVQLADVYRGHGDAPVSHLHTVIEPCDHRQLIGHLLCAGRGDVFQLNDHADAVAVHLGDIPALSLDSDVYAVVRPLLQQHQSPVRQNGILIRINDRNA